MELCKETLDDYFKKRKAPLTEEEYNKSIDIMNQLIQAINSIHSEYKILHRDLSLRNIFIGRDNIIKIGDFGLATKCHHLLLLEASPLISYLKPVTSEDCPDELLLEENSSESPNSVSESDELTHGLGTKAFAAPEQMSNSNYDQKADIYSLGLIFLALLYPTQTLSERWKIIKDCREHLIPSSLIEKHPELGNLIMKMTSDNPHLRPAANDLMKLNLCALKANTMNKQWEELNINEKELVVKVGGKVKQKYLKIIDDCLLVYSKKGNKKAKLCYPLKNSTVTIKWKSLDEEKITKENLSNETEYLRIVIEHPQLETLEILNKDSIL